MLAAGLVPQVPYPGADAGWECVCDVCSSTVFPSYSTVRRGGGCRACKRFLGYPRITEEQARLDMIAGGWQPVGAYPGSSKKWHCVCVVCGAAGFPQLNIVRYKKWGCRACHHKLVGLTSRVLDDDAVAIMRAAGLEPLEPYPTSQVPWRCQCMKCETVVFPTYTSIQQGGGCWGCARRGFRVSMPSVVYLLHHSVLGAVKVGAANRGTRRFEDHRKRGWTVITRWNTPDGYAARAAEAAVLDDWRSAGVSPAVHREDMTHGGWTETAPQDQVDLERTRTIIEDVLRAVHS